MRALEHRGGNLLGALAAAGLVAFAACGGKAAPAVRTAPSAAPPKGPEVYCLPRAGGEKLQLRLASGYTLRELVVWYMAATCHSVAAPRALLSRRSERAVDATVDAGEIDALFRSLLADMGLCAAFAGGSVMVADGPPRMVLFAPQNLQDSPPRKSAGGVRKLSDTHYYLARDALDDALAHPARAAGQVRLIPAFEAGKVTGFEIEKVDSGSLLFRLGFRAGDVVRAVNGRRLEGPDQALEAYKQLRKTDRIEVELRRDGKPLTLVVEIR